MRRSKRKVFKMIPPEGLEKCCRDDRETLAIFSYAP